MTGLESNNFYGMDQQKYILANNGEFLQWLLDRKKEGFTPLLDGNHLVQMQELIDEIVHFFEFKYPDNIFDSMKTEIGKNALQISKLLGIEQLKFRLPYDYVQFLDCPYGSCAQLHKRGETKLWESKTEMISIGDHGNLESYELQNLQEKGFVEDIDGVNDIENLLEKMYQSSLDIDYSQIERIVFQHKCSVLLRNKILELIPLALLYSKNTLPKWGYIRAKSFIRTFNKEYQLNLNMDELDQIMSIDYSKCQKQKIK